MPNHDVASLLAELGQMQADRRMGGGVWIGTNPHRKTKEGGPVFVAMCPNGYHESAESEAHALSLLVDSFRTRAEDRPEIHERIQAWGGSYADIRFARETAQRIAKKVRHDHPAADGASLDVMLGDELSKREADRGARMGKPVPQRKPGDRPNSKPDALPRGRP
jgi:hypothetical protein